MTRYRRIKTLLKLSYREEAHISLIRAKLRLFDGSVLWVREVYGDDTLDTYSYYWLQADNSLIMGWDNAPHHPDIDTFPHHKHQRATIEASQERTLEDVLQHLQEFYESL